MGYGTPLGGVVPAGFLTGVSNLVEEVTGIGDLDKLACGEDEFRPFNLLAVVETSFEMCLEEHPIVCPVGWAASVHVVKGGLFPELGLPLDELKGKLNLFLVGHVWGECEIVFAGLHEDAGLALITSESFW